MATLLMYISAESEQRKAEQEHAVWMNHNTLERGNPARRFKGGFVEAGRAPSLSRRLQFIAFLSRVSVSDNNKLSALVAKY